MKAILFLLTSLLSLSNATAGQVELRPDKIVQLSGVIEAGDLAKVRSIVEQNNLGKGFGIHLESRGGDVDEGMAIGRYLRSMQARAGHGYCASSCVLAFSGATTRSAQPGLAIHRPSAGLSLMASKDPWAKRMLEGLSNFCREMTGSDRFYNDMMATPFEKPMSLTPEQAQAMGLGQLTQ